MGHQHWPIFEIDDFTGVFIQCRAVVLGIIDIKAYVDYIPFHKRLHFAFG
jgi:hypothetical protein